MKSYRVTLKYLTGSGICAASSVIPAYNSDKAIEQAVGSITGDLLTAEAKEITEKP
jgi:hypothetical protein